MRAGPLELGGVSVPQVVVSLTDPAAVHTDDAYDGLIGVDLLRQLDLIVDAAAATVWLRRGAAFGQAFRYDRSGLTLAQVAGGLEVARAPPGSPARAAGLARGDVLTPARPMSRADFLWSLTDAPGVAVDMDAARGGQVRQVTLVFEGADLTRAR